MRNLLALSTCVFAISLLAGCDAVSKAIDNGDKHVAKGVKLYEERKFAEAVVELELALTKPLVVNERSEVLSVIGNCYCDMDDYDKAMEYHDLAIAEDPANHKFYVNKGVVYRLLGEYDQAEEMYLKALKIEPEYAELHASMGALAVFQEDYPKAVKHLEKSVALDDSLAIAHSNLAIAYAAVGRFDEAESELKKAIDRGYHQPEAIREYIDGYRANAGEGE